MIRRAVPADTDKIMSLWFRENAAAHSFIPRRFWENCAEMVRAELLPAAETFVFCDKRQIKGFISLLNGDYVGALFVREDCQGKGIGLRLLEYVRRAAAPSESPCLCPECGRAVFLPPLRIQDCCRKRQ